MKSEFSKQSYEHLYVMKHLCTYICVNVCVDVGACEAWRVLRKPDKVTNDVSECCSLLVCQAPKPPAKLSKDSTSHENKPLSNSVSHWLSLFSCSRSPQPTDRTPRPSHAHLVAPSLLGLPFLSVILSPTILVVSSVSSGPLRTYSSSSIFFSSHGSISWILWKLFSAASTFFI